MRIDIRCEDHPPSTPVSVNLGCVTKQTLQQVADAIVGADPGSESGAGSACLPQCRGAHAGKGGHIGPPLQENANVISRQALRVRHKISLPPAVSASGRR